MENFFTRYKNPLVLMVILVIQTIMLATQVKRPDNAHPGDSGGTRLIRVWTVTAFTPFERAFVSTGRFFRNTWHNYIDLHDVRRQNLQLQEQLSQLKLEQVRLRQDAEQAQRLQALLGFKDHYIGHTMPAQVIGTSGTDQSRLISIDKGSHNGVKADMAVITPDGIVGKVKDVFPLSSQVLLINDRESGAGVILQNSRLQGILKGTQQGELLVSDIMSDEKVESGEQVVTSGGDRIFPKGLPVGTVTRVAPDRENDPFLAIQVKPAADLNRLEEVLVVTDIAEEAPAVAGSTPLRAADILARRLPSAPKPDENAAKPGSTVPSSTQGASQTGVKKPEALASPNKIAPGAALNNTGAGAMPGKSPARVPVSPAGQNATGGKPSASSVPPAATATKPATAGATPSPRPSLSPNPTAPVRPKPSLTPSGTAVSSTGPAKPAATSLKTGTSNNSGVAPPRASATPAKPATSPGTSKQPASKPTPSGTAGQNGSNKPQTQQPPAADGERPPQ